LVLIKDRKLFIYCLKLKRKPVQKCNYSVEILDVKLQKISPTSRSRW